MKRPAKVVKIIQTTKLNLEIMKDLTKKQRFIIKCELGFVNAEWINGRKYPECWGFSRYEATTYSQQRADILLDLVENNNHQAFLIQIL